MGLSSDVFWFPEPVAGLFVRRMPRLRDIGAGFAALRSVGGCLTLEKNPHHAAMFGTFPALVTLTQDLTLSTYTKVTDSPGLLVIDGAFLSLVDVTYGSLRIYDTWVQRLTNSFSALETVAADLELSRMPDLVSLAGSFGALRNVTGVLAM